MDKTKNLLKIIRMYAEKHTDGHYSLFSFTGNYKGCFGTIYPEVLGFNAFLQWLPSYPTFKQLLKGMIKNPQRHQYNEEILKKAITKYEEEMMQENKESDEKIFEEIHKELNGESV